MLIYPLHVFDQSVHRNKHTDKVLLQVQVALTSTSNEELGRRYCTHVLVCFFNIRHNPSIIDSVVLSARPARFFSRSAPSPTTSWLVQSTIMRNSCNPFNGFIFSRRCLNSSWKAIFGEAKVLARATQLAETERRQDRKKRNKGSAPKIKPIILTPIPWPILELDSHSLPRNWNYIFVSIHLSIYLSIYLSLYVGM